MTPAEATEFAARITTAINDVPSWRVQSIESPHLDADRKRVALNLAGYLRALEGLAMHYEYAGFSPHTCDDCGTPWPCPDAVHYTADRDAQNAALILTGSLYGVTP